MSRFPLTRRAALALPAMALPGLPAAPALLPAPAWGQGAWPQGPVRIIVPFGAGGGTDVTIRLMAPRLSAILGQPVVVENRPGAGSTLGTDYVAKAPADGSVFVHATLSSTGIARALYRNLPYDPLRDLAAIAPTVFVPLVLAVASKGWPPGLEIHDARALVAALKAHPGRFQYGHNGIGASGHLACANFLTSIGAEAVNVPYRGGAETITALVKGEIQFMHDITGLLEPHRAAGEVRCLFVTSPERSAVMPMVPTAREAGVPDYPAYSWFGLFGPAGTPPAIQARMAGAIARVLEEPAIATRLAQMGTPAMTGYTPERFTAFVARETELWGPLVRASGAEQN
ncbi:tripartite tricarboxylate transporter substrate binding protein [Roseomonas sp. GC11]|uniref:Bug family tripartite tricarboxylate transporter substrate binding protein n=1 Tax=Roseomonas sp. GC11 TaxID=2950546 RepID=UPI00210CA64A|nr:tripartite tricarboxylate transporter substrate binding protein [Roseomonas sp. GC11]MCQ4159533.1 tripartite tricarboxylate transporter substrate binding protein [Roseomonas sp. GC11]